ncbi:MAG: tRNA pseudouridine(55) synthase TruB [Kordiimonadaceae bacterium]|jgi:tRNA pseudouridine55 synthase|nr:tRNA pseudouridine(55) synthase TruB [Kordiimonadaceae bacterium]MBT6035481.1 tRNA pseudouridine(55) synthase TruB [Kordiimonadaceae bacterium]MBT6328918.1 tRNA pseudouridine(55) synthase TruB [Kordiimonadaceae bacterium]MBT7581652.1 tRNA pseudouridine(55) synthase TruB [Kordiimonadaceae bacterium]
MARKRKGLKIDGWLAIDKPYGMGSTKVVGKCRYLTKAQKVGHAGTLDPLATGVLPIAFGEATKTIPYIMDARKTYQFEVTWGEAHTTDDLEGEITHSSDHRPTEANILQQLENFRGKIKQKPPAFSAIKIDGKRAYDLARAGEEFEIKEREVEIFTLSLTVRTENTATFEMECSKGTYVRSIGRDLALKLGTFGYISSLRRTKVGSFDLSGTISLEKLEELVHSAPLEETILNVVTVLDDILALAVTKEQADFLKNGGFIALENLDKTLTSSSRIGVTYKAMEGDKLIALCEFDESHLKPIRVFNL